MPLFILNVRLAEPPTAPRTTNRRRMMAWLMVRRHGLTKVLQICAFYFFAFHIPKHIHRIDEFLTRRLPTLVFAKAWWSFTAPRRERVCDCNKILNVNE
jgi:hypothetical protein